jgi:predicted DNA-binding protein
MATATHPTSIRLNPAEKRRIAAAARKRGLSPAAYIKRAALAGSAPSDDAKLARLERLAASLLEAVEDERDGRLAKARWENHLKNKTRLYTGEEVWRELGLQA